MNTRWAREVLSQVPADKLADMGLTFVQVRRAKMLLSGVRPTDAARELVISRSSFLSSINIAVVKVNKNKTRSF